MSTKKIWTKLGEVLTEVEMNEILNGSVLSIDGTPVELRNGMGKVGAGVVDIKISGIKGLYVAPYVPVPATPVEASVEEPEASEPEPEPKPKKKIIF